MELFQFNPLMAAFALLLLTGSGAALLLAALIESATRPTAGRRLGWRALRLLCGVGALVGLLGLWIAL